MTLPTAPSAVPAQEAAPVDSAGAAPAPAGRAPDRTAQMRQAAFARLRGASLREAAELSGLAHETLRKWQKQPEKAAGQRWRKVQEEVATELSLEGGPQAVTVDGFESPEALCDHWSLEAARVQIEVMRDPQSSRKDKLDAAKRVQELGGHSPVNKTIVVSAPLNDPRTAEMVLGVLGEMRGVRAESTERLGRFTGPALLAVQAMADVDA